jgi:hypothetical protein
MSGIEGLINGGEDGPLGKVNALVKEHSQIMLALMVVLVVLVLYLLWKKKEGMSNFTGKWPSGGGVMRAIDNDQVQFPGFQERYVARPERMDDPATQANLQAVGLSSAQCDQLGADPGNPWDWEMARAKETDQESMWNPFYKKNKEQYSDNNLTKIMMGQ